ncbi:MAG: hypothetical protein M3N51_03520 [Actinomycetota bacterium]|nr:hypothetical protein [Actinomycetota bacterium]
MVSPSTTVVTEAAVLPAGAATIIVVVVLDVLVLVAVVEELVVLELLLTMASGASVSCGPGTAPAQPVVTRPASRPPARMRVAVAASSLRPPAHLPLYVLTMPQKGRKRGNFRGLSWGRETWPATSS